MASHTRDPPHRLVEPVHGLNQYFKDQIGVVMMMVSFSRSLYPIHVLNILSA